jgi:hypothetical protein
LKWSCGLEHKVFLLWKRFRKTMKVLWSLSVNFEESSGFIAIVLFHQPMPSTWVRNFEATGSTLKKKGGSVKTVRTSENIAVVREAIERIHTVLRVATLCHSGCLKPAFDGFYTTTFLL